jgi:hypothetical protein
LCKGPRWEWSLVDLKLKKSSVGRVKWSRGEGDRAGSHGALWAWTMRVDFFMSQVMPPRNHMTQSNIYRPAKHIGNVRLWCRQKLGLMDEQKKQTSYPGRLSHDLEIYKKEKKKNPTEKGRK